MAKTKERVAPRKKTSKRGKESSKPWRHKAAKHATPKKAKSKGLLAGVSRQMTKITYEVVEHDGGWAYRVDGVFSETFSSHDEARGAAERAASEQILPGETTAISWEDKDGHWHDELSAGNDRPETEVEG
jgi:hypothetical protein